MAGVDYMLSEPAEWSALSPVPGQILEVPISQLGAGDQAANAAFVVLLTKHWSDGSALLTVRHLGAEEPQAHALLDERFNGGGYTVHLCRAEPCVSKESAGEEVEKVVRITSLTLWDVEAFKALDQYTVKGRYRSINKWMDEAQDADVEDVPASGKDVKQDAKVGKDPAFGKGVKPAAPKKDPKPPGKKANAAAPKGKGPKKKDLKGKGGRAPGGKRKEDGAEGGPKISPEERAELRKKLEGIRQKLKGGKAVEVEEIEDGSDRRMEIQKETTSLQRERR